MRCPYDTYYSQSSGLRRNRALLTKDCTPEQCSGCGWNPEIERRRKLAIRRRGGAPSVSDTAGIDAGSPAKAGPTMTIRRING